MAGNLQLSPAALGSIPATIALADLTANILIETGRAQALTIGRPSTAFCTVPTTIALAYFPTFALELTRTTEALAVPTRRVLRQFHAFL